MVLFHVKTLVCATNKKIHISAIIFDTYFNIFNGEDLPPPSYFANTMPKGGNGIKRRKAKA
ncbi:MAG TPA: hypothetical protein PKZ83_06165, partial [bacterium]|nr:hypothetical protein [bacterium]